MKLVYTIILLSTFNFQLLTLDSLAQWQPVVRLTNDPANSWISENNAWSVAANGSIVHVVWYDFRHGNIINQNWEIYYKRSTDGGNTWGADTRLTNDSSYSSLPAVAVSGSVVHVVWNDTRDGNLEIYYKRSTDAGVSWGEDTRLTNAPIFSDRSSITVSGSNVHVVWTDFRDLNYEIYYKRSSDAGETWGDDMRLTNDPAFSEYPSITASGSVVHVVWQDRRNTNMDIYYKRSTDAGVTWGTETRLMINPLPPSLILIPSISSSGSDVYVVWDDRREGNNEIYNKRSTDGGITWGPDTRLTNNLSDSFSPNITVSGSDVHIVWYEGSGLNYGIFYKRSTNSGANWESDVRLTGDSGLAFIASVAVSGPVVHVVWIEDVDENEEIFYRRNPTGNTVGVNNISSEMPKEFILGQNYPNPFNPTTTIRFRIASSGRVVLAVYDLLGKEVATLVDEQLTSGSYETTFDGSGLSSGLYFYRIRAGEFVQTKKLMLQK